MESKRLTVTPGLLQPEKTKRSTSNKLKRILPCTQVSSLNSPYSSLMDYFKEASSFLMVVTQARAASFSTGVKPGNCVMVSMPAIF